MLTDIEIAQAAKLRRISDLAGDRLGIPEAALEPYGHYKAKLALDYVDSLADRPDGKLILVTAISPTPAGEGKTTTTVGLGDALNHIGKKALICLREPSLGPVFGVKGGAAGGGYAQVVPMEDINLHFTGDFSAIALANNLLAALVDNHIHHGNELGLDVRRIAWKRVVDMNDRALRDIVVSLGGPGNGYPREDGFDIVVASEVMAIFCLATSLKDLKQRLGQYRGRLYTRPDPGSCSSAQSAWRDDGASQGCTQTQHRADPGEQSGHHSWWTLRQYCPRLQLRHRHQDGVEVGRLCRDRGGLRCRSGCGEIRRHQMPQVRAAPRCSGDRRDYSCSQIPRRCGTEGTESGESDAPWKRGIANLERHVNNVRNHFGLPCVVSINHFTHDTPAEIDLLKRKMAHHEAPVVLARHWAEGGKGAEELARTVVDVIDRVPSDFRFVYEDEAPLWDKMKAIATKIYGASEITADAKVRAQIRKLQDDGFGHYPVCVAKTQYSFSTDPGLRGAPSGHVVNVREVRLAAGAEFVVMICGDVMTMPGLPKVPSAERIDLTDDGKVVGLF